MLLKEICDLSKTNKPLVLFKVDPPKPADHEVLIKVHVCGVCHTELDEIEGRTAPPTLPVIPGHQVIGIVTAKGSRVSKLQIGDRVGVAWIFSSCGKCEYCLEGNENLCAEFTATGRDVNGGYAEYMTVGEDFAHPIPEKLEDANAAPLLCAGAIGFRSVKLSGITNNKLLGLTGFGASGHLMIKLIKHLFPQTEIFVFARSQGEREFAKSLGAAWTGETNDFTPELLDAIIDTTPVWKPVVEAMKNLKPEGRLVINAIRKENHDIDYLTRINYEEHLWMEKEIKTVANVAINDVRDFLTIAADVPIVPEVQLFPLEKANTALMELKNSKIKGAKVLQIS